MDDQLRRRSIGVRQLHNPTTHRVHHQMFIRRILFGGLLGAPIEGSNTCAQACKENNGLKMAPQTHQNYFGEISRNSCTLAMSSRSCT